MTSTLIDPRAFALIDDELDGRPVLVVVGELDLFTGLPAPLEVMRAAGQQAVAGRST